MINSAINNSLARKITYALAVLAVFAVVVWQVPVFAADPAEKTLRSVNLLVPIPGTNNTTTGEIPFNLPGAEGGYLMNYLTLLTTWVASLIGMICVGIFVFSGFQIVTSAGNSEMVSQAKGRIMDTIFGLMLLITAALLLHTINPGFFRWDESTDPSPTYGRTMTVKIIGDTVTGDCVNGTDEVKLEAKKKFDEKYQAVTGPSQSKSNFACWPNPPTVVGFEEPSLPYCEFHYEQFCRWQDTAGGQAQ